MIKIQHDFLIVFVRSWGPSWSLLGGQNRPKMGQVGLKTGLETLFFEKREFSRKALKTNEKSTILSPRGDPKRPKIVPRRPQDDLTSVLFSLRFSHRFLVAFLADFGAIWGGFGEPKSDIFGIDFSSIFTCRPKIAPRAAKSGPRAPKSRPRAAQEHPREPQEGPRVAKSDPRRPQDTRKESEKITRAVQAKQAAERERKDNEGCAEQSLREPSCAFRSLAAQVSELWALKIDQKSFQTLR